MLAPQNFQGLIAEQGGIEDIFNQRIGIEANQQAVHGGADLVGHIIAIQPPIQTGNRGFAAAYMAAHHRIAQQLTVHRDAFAGFTQDGIGIGQPAVETTHAEAAGNGNVGGEVVRLEGNGTAAGFEFEVGFVHIFIR